MNDCNPEDGRFGRAHTIGNAVVVAGKRKSVLAADAITIACDGEGGLATKGSDGEDSSEIGGAQSEGAGGYAEAPMHTCFYDKINGKVHTMVLWFRNGLGLKTCSCH